jgi:tetratricopeptide (TPR) repeat protein
MSPAAELPFPPRGARGYDAVAVETFPWPVVAGYDDVHRWMDQGQAVHAAWQLKDAWEALLKFLATLAVADHLAAAPAEDPRTRRLLDQLLKKGGLTDGDWARLMETALKDGPPPQARLPQLGPLLFQGGQRQRLFRLLTGDKDDLVADDFIEWRNRCFGHGVFRKDLASYAQEALHWLRRLHEAYALCRPLLQSLALESDGPGGEPLTWGGKSPLPFYHGHQPAAAGPLLPPVRARMPGSEALLLTPLLSVQLCVVCGQWSAFYLDKYDREKHRAQFLDFIEGHGNDHKDLEPLRTWAARLSGAKAPAAASPPPDPAERREPDPERFRDFQHEFEPPAYLAQQVADFLRTHDRGVLMLTGPGGVGKSWATQGLDQAGMLPAALGRAVALLDVSMHGPAAPRASEVRAALAERARRGKRWQVPAWPDGPEPHARFAAWLAALMRANGLGELLVALDGLDDLPADSDVPDLWPPADALPPGCYLVLSCRPRVRAAAEGGLRRVRSTPGHFAELRVGPDEPEHRAVLRSYVVKRLARPRPDGQGPLPADWAEPLIDQSGGSFLYAFHYCRALHFGVYGDLAQLPPPAAYYPAFFEHLRGRVGNELFHGHYARALALIAVAREPVGLTHLEAWGLERSRLVVMLDDLADLLRSRREPWDAETLYSLGHDAVRQFLTEDKAWQSRLVTSDRRLAELAVRRFGSDWSAVDPFDPVESYLLFHLLDHATAPELRERLLANTALAEACQGHGRSLWKKREYTPCLLAYEMALRLREDQVQRQGRRELRSVLATTYLERGNLLTRLGRLEEACAGYGTCVDLFQDLAQCESCRELREALALAYSNRGAALGALGRLEEALAEHDASIGLFEELMRGDGRIALALGLASARMNRGVALANLGRLEDALADYGASIRLYEELVNRWAGSVLHNGLAGAHMNRGNALHRLGRLEEALADFGTCIGLEEKLVQQEGRGELRNDLAIGYMNRGNTLTDLGRLEEALADSGTCIGLLEDLVHREGRCELRNYLAMAYMNRGITLNKLDRTNEALADYGASIRLYEELVKCVGDSHLRLSLARAYMNRGVALRRLGCMEEALADFGTCINDMEKELMQHEGLGELRKDLAVALKNRADTLAGLNHWEEALADYRAAVGLYENMVNREGRRELRNHLAKAFLAQGVALWKLGQLEEAQADHAAAIVLCEELVDREGRGELREDLARGYAVYACLLLHMGRLEEARQRAREAISILETEMARTGRADLCRALEFAVEVSRNACG